MAKTNLKMKLLEKNFLSLKKEALDKIEKGLVNISERILSVSKQDNPNLDRDGFSEEVNKEILESREELKQFVTTSIKQIESKLLKLKKRKPDEYALYVSKGYYRAIKKYKCAINYSVLNRLQSNKKLPVIQYLGDGGENVHKIKFRNNRVDFNYYSIIKKLETSIQEKKMVLKSFSRDSNDETYIKEKKWVKDASRILEIFNYTPDKIEPERTYTLEDLSSMPDILQLTDALDSSLRLNHTRKKLQCEKYKEDLIGEGESEECLSQYYNEVRERKRQKKKLLKKRQNEYNEESYSSNISLDESSLSTDSVMSKEKT